MLVAALMLAGCGPQPSDPGPGGVTVDEAKALDDAAAMLEDRGRSPADANAERAEAARAGQAAMIATDAAQAANE